MFASLPASLLVLFALHQRRAFVEDSAPVKLTIVARRSVQRDGACDADHRTDWTVWLVDV